MRCISHHITPLVINTLGADTHTNTHMRIRALTDVCTETILRNQVHTAMWPGHAWFNEHYDERLISSIHVS